MAYGRCTDIAAAAQFILTDRLGVFRTLVERVVQGVLGAASRR
jgi:hypothetical protein